MELRVPLGKLDPMEMMVEMVVQDSLDLWDLKVCVNC